MSDPIEIKPLPDPTTLTTDALHREIAIIEKLFETKLEALKDRTAEQKNDVKENIKDALAAAEKASTKSEAATGKEIDALKVQIGDLKSRMDRAESGKLGGSESIKDQRTMVGFGITILLFLIAVGSFVIAVVK